MSVPANDPSQLSSPPPELVEELMRLNPEQSDKLLQILRGLFQCVGELNERLRKIEEQTCAGS